jgi:hypothetical protein
MVVPGILVACVGILRKHGRFAIVFVFLSIGVIGVTVVALPESYLMFPLRHRNEKQLKVGPESYGKPDSAFEHRLFMSVTRGCEALTLNFIRTSVQDCESGIAFGVIDRFAQESVSGQTTTHVCKPIVMPVTRSSGCSSWQALHA